MKNFFDYTNCHSQIKIKILGIKFTITKKINKRLLNKKIKAMNCTNLNTQSRTPRLIVSLTSFPQRMKDIHYCLYSLLNQSVKPDKLILWLSEEEFPNKESDLPQTVIKFKEQGLSVKWCKNLKSYTKLIPSLKKYPDDICHSR